MHHGRRMFYARKRMPRAYLPILFSLILSILFFRYLSWQLRPMIETVAVSRTKNYISQNVHQLIDECLADESICYDDIVNLALTESGVVTSLSIDPIQGAHLRRMVTERLVERLERTEPEQLEIPLGTVTGFMLLSAAGPKVQIRIDSVGDVSGRFENEFVSAGVNQTKHAIYLDMTVTVYLFIPGDIVEVTSSERICIAETIIVGEVPNSYITLQKGA